MAELDLEKGDPERAEESTRRRRRTSTTSEDKEKESTEKQLDRELHVRLIDAFDHIQEWRETRDDTELAVAIAQDKEKMSKGLVSLTHYVNPLRKPLVIFLAFVEPILAFGRIGAILGGRIIGWRQRRAEEIAEAQAEWDRQHENDGQGPTPFTVPAA